MTENAGETGEAPLLHRPLGELLTFRLARLNAKLTAQAARVLAESAGISLMQWRIFALVDSLAPVTAAELSRRTHFDKALISRTLRGMIDDGFLQATPSTTDQRSQVLALTEAGRAVANRARPAMRARQERLLGALTAEELRILYACFDRIDATVDQMEQGA